MLASRDDQPWNRVRRQVSNLRLEARQLERLGMHELASANRAAANTLERIVTEGEAAEQAASIKLQARQRRKLARRRHSTAGSIGWAERVVRDFAAQARASFRATASVAP